MTREELIERINAICVIDLEYAEKHQDAGSEYAHMLAESWCKELEKRLAGQFEAVTISELVIVRGLSVWRESVLQPAIDTCGLKLDEIAKLALANFEMKPGSIYGMYDSQAWIVLDSYAVQEIEIDLESQGLTYTDIISVESDCDCYIAGTGRAYMTTDAVWFAAIKRSDLQELIRAEPER